MSITIQCNLKTVDLLDVTFDVDKNVYKPFRKEINKPIYINKHSNHPPRAKINCKTNIRNVIQSGYFWRIIKAIQRCFKRKWLPWDVKLYWTNNQKKPRKRKIIWFNPPFSRCVKSNIGRIFLRLLSKLFPGSHTMHKIFKRYISSQIVKNL